MNKKIAIIGAGLSGLTLAEKLKGSASIAIFEKSTEVGGRMSTRYAEGFQFDHGAQFFTARSTSFKQFLMPFLENGSVQQWKPKVLTLDEGKKPYKRDWFEPHYVAAPKMNMLCKNMAKHHDVKLGVNIQAISQHPQGWMLMDTNAHQHGPFDWVVTSVPNAQATALIPDGFHCLQAIQNITMQGCFSLMLGFSEPVSVNWDAVKVKNSAIGWIALDTSKPQRESGFCVVIHSTNEWAEKHLESDNLTVVAVLKEELKKIAGIDANGASYQSLHRWRYANTSFDEHDDENDTKYLIDHELKLAVCGDWLIKGHVESAYLSGEALAQAFIKSNSE